MKATAKKTKTLVIFFVLMLVGCTTLEPRYITKYVDKEICIKDSAYFSAKFSYPCEERQKAERAGAICECMATSARILIDTNREIGPTSSRALLETAVREPEQGIVVLYDTLYDTLGETAAKAYIKDIANMSIYIAERNITDRITYPNQKYLNCITTMNYVVK